MNDQKEKLRQIILMIIQITTVGLLLWTLKLNLKTISYHNKNQFFVPSVDYSNRLNSIKDDTQSILQGEQLLLNGLQNHHDKMLQQFASSTPKLVDKQHK